MSAVEPDKNFAGRGWNYRIQLKLWGSIGVTTSKAKYPKMMVGTPLSNSSMGFAISRTLKDRKSVV